MKVCVPKETVPGERRVALVPDVAGKLTGAGFEVEIQTGAGAEANFADTAYEEAGARVSSSPPPAARGEALVGVRAPERSQLEQLADGSLLIGLLSPLNSPELLRTLAERGVTAFAMEAIPRTTRAQSMDALSSQALCAGYRSTLAAARHLGKFFPMNITAAGTAAPARVLVLGAGVAGLQAIATAKRLGAVVEAYDVRPAVKEEVESLGAKFVQIEEMQPSAGGTVGDSTGDRGGSGQYAKELSEDQQRRQQELLAERAAAADCLITTAAVPGRPAPRLVSREMVESMRPGSVVVDLAAETGGNCELTQPDAVIEHNRIKIDGTLNLPSQMPFHASLLYANNVASLLQHLAPEGKLVLDFEDEITAGCCITYEGKIVSEGVREAVEGTVKV